ncbi:MAG: M23 family metallopeptidase [Chitinophagaceae bacterium]|nr:M23 family metallopeptidase [Chitinophagaceae bacterium]MBK7678038.1 M23 family metallopeptidase [Chitinophagaceae bacterium]MBK8301356.1 M23 family metallopeptidase [Chitinophagaceae bacterium]MBK9658316.1 M23 family metallopeptidase [Chitinophagaceae bacterium]MBK9938571.1 M23 family metallopeptidase [Chitinophagaceae bacterium]
MYYKIILLVGVLVATGCAVSKNPLRQQVKLLQEGIIKDDTSYVYALPYEEGKTFRVLQGYFTGFTHRERAALDFNMKRGTKITAARDGVVVRAKEDGTLGGLNKKYRSHGNNIVIQHADNSRAGYWHLQHNGALVNVGDSVKKGQVIAISGKTGFAFVPHLHFLVWTSKDGQWQQVATRFQTSKGIKYLRGWKKYRNSPSE